MTAVKCSFVIICLWAETHIYYLFDFYSFILELTEILLSSEKNNSLTDWKHNLAAWHHIMDGMWLIVIVSMVAVILLGLWLLVCIMASWLGLWISGLDNDCLIWLWKESSLCDFAFIFSYEHSQTGHWLIKDSLLLHFIKDN